jgi:acyl-CoA synthetase (NDP forming)
MAMTADVSRDMKLEFAPLSAERAATLREVLTDRVTIANPFDIHTYLWFDPPALKRVFSEVLHSGYDAAGFMLDSPPQGKADSAAMMRSSMCSSRLPTVPDPRRAHRFAARDHQSAGAAALPRRRRDPAPRSA